LISAIPNWLVRKVAGYPAGMKMPHRGKFWEQGGYKPAPFIGSLFHSGTDKTGDPLNGGDYRYWCGIEATSMCTNKGFATCRACGEVIITRKERKEHLKIGCGQLLEKAFKLLKRSQECIVCKKETHRKVYGVPMCNKDCEFEWEFTTATPSGLRYILDDVSEGN